MAQSVLLIQSLIDKHREKFTQLCVQHHVKTLYAFGSVLTDSFNTKSDLDLLYSIDLENFTNWDTSNDYDYADNLLSFEKGLTNFFNKKIDLIPDINFTNQYLKQNIEKTKYRIYAA